MNWTLDCLVKLVAMSISRSLAGLLSFVILVAAGCSSASAPATPTASAQVRFVTPTRPAMASTPVPPREAATPLPAGEWQEYIVQPGDNLWSISQRYGLTVQDLVKANGLNDPNRLAVGQKLRIPPKATPTPTP